MIQLITYRPINPKFGKDVSKMTSHRAGWLSEISADHTKHYRKPTHSSMLIGLTYADFE